MLTDVILRVGALTVGTLMEGLLIDGMLLDGMLEEGWLNVETPKLFEGMLDDKLLTVEAPIEGTIFDGNSMSLRLALDADTQAMSVQPLGIELVLDAVTDWE